MKQAGAPRGGRALARRAAPDRRAASRVPNPRDPGRRSSDATSRVARVPTRARSGTLARRRRQLALAVRAHAACGGADDEGPRAISRGADRCASCSGAVDERSVGRRDAATASRSAVRCRPCGHRRRRRGDLRFRCRRGRAPPARHRAPLPASATRLTRCRVKIRDPLSSPPRSLLAAPPAARAARTPSKTRRAVWWSRPTRGREAYYYYSRRAAHGAGRALPRSDRAAP